MQDAIRNIYTVNLGVKRDERVLVFTDTIRSGEELSDIDRARRNDLLNIAKEVAEAGRTFADIRYVEFPSVMGHGKEPPFEMWVAAFGAAAAHKLSDGGLLDRIIAKGASVEDLKNAEEIIITTALSPGAIIALSNNSTSHTRYRDFLTRSMHVRYASMPIFERFMLTGAMTADWTSVKERTERLIETVRDADMAYITSHNGTSISFSVAGRNFLPDTGIITEPGSFSNLPAGEAFVAPVEGTAEGLLVLEWAPTGKLPRPISLKVEKGSVVDISGDGEFAVELRGKLKANPLTGNIAELGIGTNEKAARPDNILETEKILGTVHIAIGDNSSFGGKVSVPFHQDFIFFQPTLEVTRGEKKIEVISAGAPRF